MPASRRNIVFGMVGASLVSWLPFFRKRPWYGSSDIFELADPTIMRDIEVVEKEVARWEARIKALRQEQGLLIASFGRRIDDADRHAYAKLLRAELDVHGQVCEAIAAHGRLLAHALDDIYDKLGDGRLVARGCVARVGASVRRAQIPARHWATLRFNGDYYTGEYAEAPKEGRRVTYINLDHIGDYAGASNDNVRYVGLELARS